MDVECATDVIGNMDNELIMIKMHLPPGKVNWKHWVLFSHGAFIGLLIFCLVLVHYDYWPSLHHRKVDLSSDSRRRIKQLVQENRRALLDTTKEVIDSRLEDGE